MPRFLGAVCVLWLFTYPAAASQEEVEQAKELIAGVWQAIAAIIGPPHNVTRDGMLEFQARAKQAIEDDKLCFGSRKRPYVFGRPMYAIPALYDPIPGMPDYLAWGITLQWADEDNKKREAAVRFIYYQKYVGNIPDGSPRFEAEFRDYRMAEDDPKRITRLLHSDGRWSFDGKRFFLTLTSRAHMWVVALDTLINLDVDQIVRECSVFEKRKRA